MSAIEWTDETWNPVVGCRIVSPACTNCYAMRLAGGRLRHHPTYEGLTEPSKAGPVWNGKVAFVERALAQPLHWRKPRRIFVNSMGDLFHEDVPDAWIDKVFAVMALCPQHTFQVLTKRPERMWDYLVPRETLIRIDKALVPLAGLHHPDPDALNIDRPQWPLPNVWLGTSIEDAPRLARLEVLRDTPAAVRFVSLEPLLGPLEGLDLTGIHWVIAGGESGPGARPMHPDWVRSIRDQCQAAGVAYFFKQWGGYEPIAAAEHMVDHLSLEGDADDVRDSAERCVVVWPNGARLQPGRSRDWWFDQDFESDGDLSSLSDCPVVMRRVGKKTAGRELDGRTWDEYPS